MGMFLTDAGCIEQRKFVNIPAWHEKGYLGEGLTAFCDDINDPDHYGICADMIQTILPKARVFTGTINYTSIGGVIAECKIKCNETKETMPFDDFIKKYDVSLINNSTDGGEGERVLTIAVYMRGKIKEHNLIFTGSAGNAYGLPTDNPYNGACIMVTRVKLENGRPVYGKKSIGDNLDFSMFSGFATGTSFSSPFLLGMCGLLRCKCPKITQEAAYQYLKDHCVDIETVGKDVKSGWGVPVLGDPKTIIKMWPGKNFMTVDGIEVPLDQPPEIVRSTKRTLVPARAISEAFGADVDWDAKTETITIVK